MNTTLFNEILELPIETRLDLVSKLLESISPKTDDLNDALWKEEIIARHDETKDSNFNLMSEKEVCNYFNTKLGQ